MQALILAAGKGERLRPLTEAVPKVMLPVANKPLLRHNMEKLKGLVDEIILVVGYREDTIKDYFGSEFDGINITYVTQKEQLGTGHAVKQAEHLINGRFLLMMGDNLYQRKDIEKCLKHDLSILTRSVDNPRIFGVCTVEDGLLKDITEKPDRPSSNMVNAALYVLDKRILEYGTKKTKRGEYEIVDAITDIAQKSKVYAIETDDCEFITYPWDLLRVNQSIVEKTGPVIDRNAKISREAKVEGPVVIGKNAELKNCVVRPYSVIGDGAVIGNFVEIKNSIIMENTKIPHLSYIGDSVIGRNCNLGAGTKIANLRFDDGNVKVNVKGRKVDSGRRKLGCFMGDNVKTGINVSILPGAAIKSGTCLEPGKTFK